jgi:hypothetical protein
MPASHRSRSISVAFVVNTGFLAASSLFCVVLGLFFVNPGSLSPAWDTDSKQGFIQAPTGLRDEEEKERKAKQADIVPKDRRLNLGPHNGPKGLLILYRTRRENAPRLGYVLLAKARRETIRTIQEKRGRVYHYGHP